MKRRYVLKNKGRFYIFVMMVTIILSSISLLNFSQSADAGQSYTTVVVERGDTLWDLAKQYNDKGDLRQYIKKIEEANHINDSMIYEGDVLKMPM
ncbi:MAG: LysM peptidoglycan-binding domain-containing protein [Clostridiaceae bacterium]|jgi:nucleoid-associated protein YgaU|nr:LysM peptidoglycan-binding domain-containing protein [Clostridiaceae bacterium]